MKQCRKCLITKEDNLFNKNVHDKDGLFSWCKECKKIWSREYIKRPRPAQYRKEYIKKYRIENADKISKQRAEHRKDPEVIKKELEYRRSKEFLARQKERIKQYRLDPSNQIKIVARYAIRNLVRRGMLEKQACAICNTLKTQAHHPDYNKPLCVIWLCAKCHKQEHLKILRKLK